MFVVGCASKNEVASEEKLADADLFDGLKEAPQGEQAALSDYEGLPPAEDSDRPYAGDNIVADSAGASGESAARGGYDYYYTAVGGETLGRLAYAIYNNRKAVSRILAMNPNLRGVSAIPANTRIVFDMKRAQPRAEFLTKDMIERYRAELYNKVRAQRLKAQGNEQLAEVVVQRGDTLQVISNRLYGTTRLWTELFIINQKRVANFDNLKVGTTLNYYPVTDFMPATGLAETNSADQSNYANSVPAAAEPAPPAVLPEEPKASPQIEAAAPAAPSEPVVAGTTDSSPTASGGSPVSGGIAVDPSKEPMFGDSSGATAPPEQAAVNPTAEVPTPQKQIRPPPPDPELVGEESFFSANFRTILYVTLLCFVIIGGYLLTRPNGGFRKNKFSGIQPMPGPSPGAPLPRAKAPVNNSGRVFVNRSGTTPPTKNDQQKTG